MLERPVQEESDDTIEMIVVWSRIGKRSVLVNLIAMKI